MFKHRAFLGFFSDFYNYFGALSCIVLQKSYKFQIPGTVIEWSAFYKRKNS